MKIEDIKPDDVIVRTKDKILFKVAEVTPEGKIMQSANGKMNEVFCIFQEPKTMSFCSEEDYELATEEQRRYMDSKLADFYGTNQEAKSRRIIALASIIGDLKQENNALIERVKKLTDDNTRMAKRIDSSRSLSDLTEALDKMEVLERDCDFFRKEYDHGQRLYESLFNQHDLQRKELNVVREERDEAKEQYKDLQQKYEELQKTYDAVKDELQKLEDERNALEQQYSELQKIHTVLFFKNDAQNAELSKAGDTLKQLQDDKDLLREQLDIANANCKKTEEEREAAKEQYNDLQHKYEELSQQLNTANSKYKCADKRLDEADEEYYTLSSPLEVAESLIARFENADIEHADFSTMAFDCPHDVEAKVCSAECLGCEHCLTHGNTGTRSILCAYTYDKKKEKEQYLDKFHAQMNRDLNSEKQ